MNLTLVREIFSDKSTIGSLLDEEGEFICYTLEDRVREDPNKMTVVNEAKVYGETAIPSGTYKVIVTWSPRFKRQLPLLIGVPGFEGIRIHTGNTDKDTEGCILVGMQRGKDIIYDSRVAFNILYKKIAEGKDISITIK